MWGHPLPEAQVACCGPAWSQQLQAQAERREGHPFGCGLLEARAAFERDQEVPSLSLGALGILPRGDTALFGCWGF